MVRYFVEENKTNWDQYLPLLTGAYPSTVHQSTCFTPNMLIFRREVNLPINLLFPQPAAEEPKEYLKTSANRQK